MFYFKKFIDCKFQDDEEQDVLIFKMWEIGILHHYQLVYKKMKNGYTILEWKKIQPYSLRVFGKMEKQKNDI